MVDRTAARAEAVLLGLDHGADDRAGTCGVVDMVGRRLGADTYRLAASDGSVTFRSSGGGSVNRGFEIVEIIGLNPVADQNPAHLATAGAEIAQPHPDRADNSFPAAFERLASVFDHPEAPDLVVLHHPGHHNHGTLGEHGGLSVGQSRAPFILSGCGVRPLGVVDDHLMMVDVAPTVVRLLTGGELAATDGQVAERFLTGETADHVVLFLIDGTNHTALAKAIADGVAPNIAGLITASTDTVGTAPAHGVIASLPSVTLANHATANTGLHPGHSGVLHNEWLSADGPVNLLDVPQMIRSGERLLPGVETIHEAVHRLRPNAFTAATFEFIDRGADWSTYSVLRAGEVLDVPEKDEPLPYAHAESLSASSMFHFMSRIDTASIRQAINLWDGSAGTPQPNFLWVNLSLTDEAGHEAGPHSDLARQAIIDSDHRIGAVLGAIDASGQRARTAVIVMADHGMQLTDPSQTGSVSSILSEAGIDHVDIGDGLVYLDR